MEILDILVYLDKRIEDFVNQNKEISEEIEYLTVGILRKDLEEALKYDKGYYKNKKGLYIYIKGIEVTNDVSNLCRMGYNGEDRGVWIHYCEIQDKRAMYLDLPIGTFCGALFSRNLPEEERLYPTTKEDFDSQVKKTIENITSDYEQKRDVREYLDFFEKWDKLYDEVKKDYENINIEEIQNIPDETNKN